MGKNVAMLLAWGIKSVLTFVAKKYDCRIFPKNLMVYLLLLEVESPIFCGIFDFGTSAMYAVTKIAKSLGYMVFSLLDQTPRGGGQTFWKCCEGGVKSF